MNKNLFYFLGFIGVVLVIIAGLNHQKKFVSTIINPNSSGSQEAGTSSSGDSFQHLSPGSGSFGGASASGIEFQEKFSSSRKVSEKAKEEFSNVGKIELKVPENLRFQPLDLDFEHVTGMFAHTEKMQLSVLAGRLVVSEKKLMEFLRSSDTGIPNVDRKGFKFSGAAVEVAPVSGSGLNAGKYWQGRTSDGQGVRVGMIPRQDGKGSYLFIFTGVEDKLDNSEDLFESMYLSLKALP